MAEQNKRRNLRWKFKEVAKLGKASDNDQSRSEWTFWYDLPKNGMAKLNSDKVNDFRV